MSQSAMSPWARRISVAVFVIIVIVGWNHREDLKAAMEPIFTAVNAMGPWAPLALAAIYIPACMCMVPNTLLSPGVGFFLGPVTGTVVAILGLTAGASCNYFVGRGMGRQWFYHRVPNNPRLKAVEIACQREGLKIVFLTRLTPVFPSNVMSYFFGITSVPWRHYALGTALGLLPRTVVYTTVGAAAKTFAETSASHFEDQPLVKYALYTGAVVTLFVLIAISRIARRALNDALDKHEAAAAELPLEAAAAGDVATETAA